MDTFHDLWADLAPIGRDPSTGGYHRFAYAPDELLCRSWFASAAADVGMEHTTDRNGNLWARWVPPGVDASTPSLVLGSHLDSVPDGGAFDGPLGVVSAFAAIDDIRTGGMVPARPIAVVAFADEEGAPFGIACAGSRLMTGELDPDRARALVGRDGRTMAQAMVSAGHDPEGLGPDLDALRGIASYVELHIEQGRALVDLDAPIGVATRIWPHGRYRFTLTGEANHAGTTAMNDRHDPMIVFAEVALAARRAATAAGARATFGRLTVHPNGTNAIPSEVTAWLDARAASPVDLADLLEALTAAAESSSRDHGTALSIVAESVSGETAFDPSLSERIASVVSSHLGRPTPAIPTGAGHDAGILATAGVPSAMLFVRNPTGVSHSPAEFAAREDCEHGVAALSAVIANLAR